MNRLTSGLDFFVCGGHDHSSSGVESQGHRTKLERDKTVGRTSILDRIQFFPDTSLWWVDRVCVCVRLSARMYPEPRARSLSNFYGCFLWPWLGPLQQDDEIPRGRGNFGVFFPIDNALYSIAFGTHTKTAEPNEMPFGMMSELGPITVCYVGWRSPNGRVNFGGNMCPTSLIHLWITNWTGPCSGVHTTGADAWLQALNESIISRERGNCTTRATSDIYDCLLLNNSGA